MRSLFALLCEDTGHVGAAERVQAEASSPERASHDGCIQYEVIYVPAAVFDFCCKVFDGTQGCQLQLQREYVGSINICRRLPEQLGQ